MIDPGTFPILENQSWKTSDLPTVLGGGKTMGVPLFRVIYGGDIFRGRHSILVCPVCCVPGTMGAGLALEFAKRFPGIDKVHRVLAGCQALRTGAPCMVGERGVTIVLFPTKDRWRDPSRFRWVFQGLGAMYDRLEPCPKASIGMPALGCGLGGLDWGLVRGLVEAWSSGLDERFSVTLYGPRG